MTVAQGCATINPQSTNRHKTMAEFGLYNLKLGDTVYLYENDSDTNEHMFMSEHTVTKILKSRIYVSGIPYHFTPFGSKPGIDLVCSYRFLSFDKPE